MSKLPKEDLFFIPFNVPSSKNSRVSTSRGNFRSAAVSKYLRLIGIQHYSSKKKEVKGYTRKPNLFKESLKDFSCSKDLPLVLGYHLIRKDKRKFDYHNVVQIIADLLTAHDLIEDDDCENLVIIPYKYKGTYYTVDKDNPGVYLKILNDKTIKY